MQASFLRTPLAGSGHLDEPSVASWCFAVRRRVLPSCNVRGRACYDCVNYRSGATASAKRAAISPTGRDSAARSADARARSAPSRSSTRSLTAREARPRSRPRRTTGHADSLRVRRALQCGRHHGQVKGLRQQERPGVQHAHIGKDGDVGGTHPHLDLVVPQAPGETRRPRCDGEPGGQRFRLRLASQGAGHHEPQVWAARAVGEVEQAVYPLVGRIWPTASTTLPSGATRADAVPPRGSPSPGRSRDSWSGDAHGARRVDLVVRAAAGKVVRQDVHEVGRQPAGQRHLTLDAPGRGSTLCTVHTSRPPASGKASRSSPMRATLAWPCARSGTPARTGVVQCTLSTPGCSDAVAVVR